MELPTGVLAYRVLKDGNISNKKQQPVRATLRSLTYENMRKQFKTIYDSLISLASENNVKEENNFKYRVKRVMSVVNVITSIVNIIV